MWNISELDKNKTEQSIINESARLAICHETLERLQKEYNHKRYIFLCELANIEDKMTTLETSITSGEKFIENCKNHLNDFINE